MASGFRRCPEAEECRVAPCFGCCGGIHAATRGLLKVGREGRAAFERVSSESTLATRRDAVGMRVSGQQGVLAWRGRHGYLHREAPEYQTPSPRQGVRTADQLRFRGYSLPSGAEDSLLRLAVHQCDLPSSRMVVAAAESVRWFHGYRVQPRTLGELPSAFVCAVRESHVERPPRHGSRIAGGVHRVDYAARQAATG